MATEKADRKEREATTQVTLEQDIRVSFKGTPIKVVVKKGSTVRVYNKDLSQ
jgi:hypothetical protein